MDRKNDSVLEEIIKGFAFLGLETVLTVAAPIETIKELYSEFRAGYEESVEKYG